MLLLCRCCIGFLHIEAHISILTFVIIIRFLFFVARAVQHHGREHRPGALALQLALLTPRRPPCAFRLFARQYPFIHWPATAATLTGGPRGRHLSLLRTAEFRLEPLPTLLQTFRERVLLLEPAAARHLQPLDPILDILPVRQRSRLGQREQPSPRRFLQRSERMEPFPQRVDLRLVPQRRRVGRVHPQNVVGKRSQLLLSRQRPLELLGHARAALLLHQRLDPPFVRFHERGPLVRGQPSVLDVLSRLLLGVRVLLL
mmetsp:Transcript_24759/g.59701  ORF Transcript_24759/g.59701 Transcript_24759/m.59701 type:complete len:258 (-) Transcript_24759:685-1458(-)